jgi:L-ascorbate metabolism protein UlaG (beta-lactamase superfamily)
VAPLCAALLTSSHVTVASRAELETPELYLPEPLGNAVTFWGHAACYIDVNGYGIVTDPVFEESYGIVYRRKIPPPPPEVYGRTRLVLLSHAHSDHLSVETLARFPATTTVLCSADAAAYLEGLELDVRTMALGESFDYPGGRVIAVPADHPGSRFSIASEPDGRALGFVVETPWAVLYYSGDTDYFEGFADVGARHAPDLALLNINAHLKPEDAAPAVADLGDPLVVPMHYGAFTNLNELRTPRWHNELAALLGDLLVKVGVGESVSLDKLHDRRQAATMP